MSKLFTFRIIVIRERSSVDIAPARQLPPIAITLILSDETNQHRYLLQTKKGEEEKEEDTFEKKDLSHGSGM